MCWASIVYHSEVEKVSACELLMVEQRALGNKWTWIPTLTIKLVGLGERQKSERGTGLKKGGIAGPTRRQNRLDRVNFFSLKSRYILFLFLKNKHYKKNLNRESEQWTNRRKNDIHFFLLSKNKTKNKHLFLHFLRIKTKDVGVPGTRGWVLRRRCSHAGRWRLWGGIASHSMVRW